MNTTKSKIIRETAKHLELPPVFAKDKWPELQKLAVGLANYVCAMVNNAAPATTVNEPCAYPAQCTLELLINELQRRV